MSTPVMHRADDERYGRIVETRAGLDWISCSLAAEAPGRWEWANECVDIIARVADDGHQVGPFGLNGYKGILAGGCFQGKREDGSYVQLAGAYAQQFYRRIARPDLHVSRLDLAVTVKFAEMPSQLGAEAYTEAAESAQSLPNGRHRKIWRMEGTDGGYTLYIGSPSSDQRARIYNKEVQSGIPDYANTWRFEVVLRNALAQLQFESICAVHEVYAALLVSSVVREWLLVRGVSAPWASSETDIKLPIEAKTPSDAQRRLQWLEKQVKPAVKWLIEKGYANEVRAALGIPE